MWRFDLDNTHKDYLNPLWTNLFISFFVAIGTADDHNKYPKSQKEKLSNLE